SRCTWRSARRCEARDRPSDRPSCSPECHGSRCTSRPCPSRPRGRHLRRPGWRAVRGRARRRRAGPRRGVANANRNWAWAFFVARVEKPRVLSVSGEGGPMARGQAWNSSRARSRSSSLRQAHDVPPTGAGPRDAPRRPHGLAAILKGLCAAPAACGDSRGAAPRQSSRQTGLHMRFEGSSNYVATDDLKLAVNAAITLERPLLIKGEPGTGKTMLAEEVAAALDMPLLQWHIKS